MTNSSLRCSLTIIACLVITLLFPLHAHAQAGERVAVGSKQFTESVVLGEIVRTLAERMDVPARHQAGLGGTGVVFQSLIAGEIDVYVEYTGTLTREILAGESAESSQAIRTALAQRSLAMTEPLGFNNTYAIGMREDRARELNIRSISDLADHPALRLGFNSEFLDRGDGWPSLREAYSLPHRDVRGMDHSLAYQALAAGQIDVMEFYSTDAEIVQYNLVALEDDLDHFPTYNAVVLYRADLAVDRPDFVAALNALAGTIDEETMTALNARVRVDRLTERAAAAEFLDRLDTNKPEEPRAAGSDTTELLRRFWRNTVNHFLLVGVSMGAALIVAIPLGIIAARLPTLGHGVLGITAILLTIPSVAMFVFMIPVLGTGFQPAAAALFFYSLLPIVRNTHAGLRGIPAQITESARVLGLTSRERLFLVELPMASRSILAGIKVAVVLNIGTATLGPLIGAGGYGEPIFTGLRRGDHTLIFEGAIPAASMAILAQLFFEQAERLFIPKGLRLSGGTGKMT